MRRRVIALATSLIVTAGILAGAVGTAAAAGPTVTVVGSAETVRPTDSPRGASGASLLAGRNEFESFQVVISAGDSTLQGVNVELASAPVGAAGTIPEENITLYRAVPYDVTAPTSDAEGATGGWYDALIPVRDTIYGERRDAFSNGAFSLDVAAGRNAIAWVDVLVPQGQAPGDYEGSLRVTANGGFSVDVPLRVTVLNYALPSTPTHETLFGLTHGKLCAGHFNGDADCPSVEERWELTEAYARIGLDNRINLDNIAPADPSYPAAVELFRRHLLPLYKGTSQSRLPGARLENMLLYSWCDADCIAAWKEEARVSGFSDQVSYAACDEPNNVAARWEACARSREIAHNVWPGLPIVVTAVLPHAEEAGADEWVNLMVAQTYRMHDRPGTNFAGNQRPSYDAWEASDADNEVWLYNACPTHGCDPPEPAHDCDPLPTNQDVWNGWGPSYVIDQPASQHRAAGWIDFLYRAQGHLYYETVYSYWQPDANPALNDPWERQYCWGGHGDGTLFYPGTPTKIGGQSHIPIESIRIKRIRDGQEDYEWLSRVAEQEGQAAAMQVARDLMPTPYEATVSDAAINAARLELFGLLGLVNAPPPTAVDDACPQDQVPPSGFTDTAGNAHRRTIDCIVWYGITRGITATEYGPGRSVTREQMASFLARLIDSAGVELPPPSDQGFTDIAQSVHRDRINQLAAAGLALGTSSTTYAPRQPVKRPQMATFLVRTFEYIAGRSLTASRDYFADDDFSPHEENINRVAEAGFASGTGPGTFGVRGDVRRDQMASFLARMLNTLVAEGFLQLPSDQPEPTESASPSPTPTATASPTASPTPTPAADPPTSIDLAFTSSGDPDVLDAGDRIVVTFDSSVDVPDGSQIRITDDDGEETVLTCGTTATCTVNGAQLSIQVSGTYELSRRYDEDSDGTGDEVLDSDVMAIADSTIGNAAGTWNLPRSGTPMGVRVVGTVATTNAALAPAVDPGHISATAGSNTVTVNDPDCTAPTDYDTVYVTDADGTRLGVGSVPGDINSNCGVSITTARDLRSGETLYIYYRIAGPFWFSETTPFEVP